MRRNVNCIVFLLVVISVLCLFSLLPNDSIANENLNTQELAMKLVNDCAQIIEGDIVSVSGGINNAELLEDIGVEVRKLGVFPLLRFSSDRYNRKSILKVPEKFDTQNPKLGLELANLFTATISIDYNEDFTILNDISPERLATFNKTYQPVRDLYQKRNTKRVYLGNNLYPNDARAKQFGVSKEELAKVFWAGVNVDYKKLEKIAGSLSQSLAAGKKLHFTSESGTDLKVKINNRKILSSDGVISENDVAVGGAATTVWLPAGEVLFTVVPGTAEGTVVDDLSFFTDKEIRNLILKFEKGKLVSKTCSRF